MNNGRGGVNYARQVGIATTYGSNENNVWEWGNRTIGTAAELHAVTFADADHGCGATYPLFFVIFVIFHKFRNFS